jgi:long-chain acyl-CoA synthetase
MSSTDSRRGASVVAGAGQQTVETLERTIPELWRRATETYGSSTAFLKATRGGWREVSFAEAAAQVDELAAGFLAIGIEKGDRVAILSRTRLEWTLCDYALASVGAVVVPIYPTSSPVECAYVLGNSGARAIVCEDDAQVAKVTPTRVELEALRQVIAIEGADDGSMPLDELAARGRALLEERPQAVEQARRQVTEDDVFTIVYTSGTTGPAKGCVLAHKNYAEMTRIIRRVEVFEPTDVALLHLPLAHTFGRLVQLAGAEIGFRIAFCPDAARLGRDLVEVRPTLLPSVPRVFEKAHSSVRARIERSRGPRRRAALWALSVGYRASRLRQRGLPIPRRLAFELRAADRLLLARIRSRFGGRLRYAISGGAPLAREVAEFFHAVGILVLEGYGLTEGTTAAAMNRPDRYRFGTVGPPLPGCEVAVAADGEVLIRGETVFRGYYGDERTTQDVLAPDGWLKTGDLGSLDADGFLTITDRKKDIIVTAGGKKVSPQNLEAALKASRYVSEALVVGDRRPYVVALLTVDRDEVAAVARTEAEVRELVGRVVESVNRDVAPYEQVRRFAILERDFLPERAEVTPTLKLRRRVCEEHFRDEIARLYGL